jgi:hypothetical protein
MITGIKYDDDKLDYTLIPFESLEEVVKVLMFGAKKYNRDNWKYVKPKERYLKAALRHLIDYIMGEKIDKESGINHLAHCACCLLFLIWHDKGEQDE